MKSAGVKDCIKLEERVEEVEYEIPGTSADPDSNTARRGRENVQKQVHWEDYLVDRDHLLV